MRWTKQETFGKSMFFFTISKILHFIIRIAFCEKSEISLKGMNEVRSSYAIKYSIIIVFNRLHHDLSSIDNNVFFSVYMF